MHGVEDMFVLGGQGGADGALNHHHTTTTTTTTSHHLGFLVRQEEVSTTGLLVLPVGRGMVTSEMLFCQVIVIKFMLHVCS